VRELDGWVESSAARTRHDPRSWLALEGLAQGYRARALLTGEWLDFGRAREAVDRAFAVAPGGVGPFLTRAQLDASLHRWDRIEGDLVATENAMPKDEERSAIAALRAERAFQCGRYGEAIAGYEAALGLDRSSTRLFALADARNQLGEPVIADRLLDEAERLAPDRDRVAGAWLQMQRGVIEQERGHLAEARRRYERADGIMPGWWRVEGRLAGLRAAEGDVDGAIASYRALVKRTGSAEFMDALARLHRARGEAAEAGRWIAVARAIYDGELAEAPEAACGHGLDHALDLEDDPACAVRLAEMNHRLRPGGEATVKLARAYLKAGRTAEAAALIDGVLATPWRTAALAAAVAQIHAAAR
jgi:tetratricopeptide (TPR) repeat protein